MKRDWFNRGVRMQHQFGETEKRNDPVGWNTFDPPPFFTRPGMRDLSNMPATGPCEMSEYGVHSYRPDPSPVQKPGGGFAVTNGPERTLDFPEAIARPIPVGTKRRIAPPIKSDK